MWRLWRAAGERRTRSEELPSLLTRGSSLDFDKPPCGAASSVLIETG